MTRVCPSSSQRKVRREVGKDLTRYSMSLNTHPGDGQPEDSYLVFARWLITRTKEGSLGWDGQAQLISAQLRSMVAEFTTYPSRKGAPQWCVFTVHDARAELMRVSPLVRDRSPLARALDDLFAVIIKSARPSSFWRRLHPAWLLR